ncbi:unnamed protein product [Pocillopora meandrina]|uniref:Uncharacterized protein n=1 Tax=Pocillopora meandrina TaxID=46732 RepID=A0AAU9Y819_9CNID|nr:unnamed protein product [Pocillopora meandrina]
MHSLLEFDYSQLSYFHSSIYLGLNDRLKTTVLSSKANGTFIVYNRAFCGWNQFANDKLNGKAFLASSFHVVLYLQHLLEETH